MPVTKQKMVRGIRTTYREYSLQELEKAWNQKGQGHNYAVEGKFYVVKVPCNKDQALEITKWFVENKFAIPTCCHYTGKTLHLYCGDAGGWAEDLRIAVEKHVLGLGFKVL